MHHPTDRITHTTAFVTPVVEHWLEREIAQWVHPMKNRSDDPSHHEQTLLPRSYISLPEEVGRLQLVTRDQVNPNIKIVSYFADEATSPKNLYRFPSLKSIQSGPGRQMVTRVAETKGGNVLFNNPLNTFHLRLYSERGNPLLPLHGLLLRWFIPY